MEYKPIENSNPILRGIEKILLVDDETAVVRVEQQMLERLGYRVTAFTSSADALKAFESDSSAIDLVLTDLTMQNMTGVQLAKRLISIRPDIPIIISTGYSEKISDQKKNALGIKGVMMKPVDKSDMAQTVRKVLDMAKGEDQ